jgi:MoaA/NifB/PqqE/SkfB family radical SAM enzyme
MQIGPFDQLSKALSHRDRLLAISRGDFLPPVSVKIELTNVCNHDCHFCAYRRIVQDAARKELLPTELVLSLIDELAAGGAKAVMFTGGGEPLLHPEIETIFARCRQRSLSHALITNGTRLSRLSDDAVGGLTWVRFSINAGDDETYAKVHGADASEWGRVWTQVSRAANKKVFPKLTVGVSFVVTTWNAAGLERAAATAQLAGADYVHFRPAFRGPDTELERQLDPSEVSDALGRLEELERETAGSFRVYGIARRFQEIAAPPREHIHCRSTPLVAYVLPSGDVSLCTLVRGASFNPKVKEPFLGNLHNARFFDLWNTPRHKQLIEGLSSSGCERCHFAEYNRALALVEQDALHADFL